MSGQSASQSRFWYLLPRVIVVVLLVGIGAALMRPRLRLGEMNGDAMGTTYTVRVVTHGFQFGPNDEEALQATIDSYLQGAEIRTSADHPGSELFRFNRQTDGRPYEFSKETFDVLNRSMQISEMTGGAFDMTAGPIANAYGFGVESRPAELPSEAKLIELRQRVGYRMVKLDGAKRTACKQRGDVYCDLSAIARGYGVDRVAKLIESRGIHHYMVEVGGAIRVVGLNAFREPWRVAITKPTEQGRATHRVIELTNKAIVTADDVSDSDLDSGKRMGHEVDPRTGKVVHNDLASVSVIADDCESADALATAMMVLGSEEGYELAKRERLAVVFLVRQRGGELVERTTPAFDALIADEPAKATARRSAS